MSDENLTIAGGGNPLRLATYDFLCVISHELQASSYVMNAVARVAAALFPDRIDYVDRSFIPNMWMNRVMVQAADGRYLMVDAKLWHDAYHYLTKFSGVNIADFRYDTKERITFPEWFERKVKNTPFVDIDTTKTYEDIPETVTHAYVDIVNRLAISIYVLDAFGSTPRETIRQNLNQHPGQSVMAAPPVN